MELKATSPWTNCEDSLFDDGFVAIAEIGRFVPIHVQHFRKLSRSGRAPPIEKVAGRAVIRRSVLRAWLRAQGRPID